MPKPQTRREFLKTAAHAALGAALVGPVARRARAAAKDKAPNIGASRYVSGIRSSVLPFFSEG